MKCPNCGKEIQDGSKFCNTRGTKIEDSTLDYVDVHADSYTIEWSIQE